MPTLTMDQGPAFAAMLQALKKHGKHAPLCSETNNAHCEVCAALKMAQSSEPR